jgi:hypothetical protein
MVVVVVLAIVIANNISGRACRRDNEWSPTAAMVVVVGARGRRVHHQQQLPDRCC